MKRFIILLMAVVFLISLPLVSPGAKKKPEAAVCFPGTVEFFKSQKVGMDKAAKQFGLKLIYADAEWDAGKQLAQVENFAAKGVDVILLCAADNEALMPAVDVCKEAKIPLITFTNVLGPNPDGKLDGVVSFIGTNEIKLGRLLGKMAEQLLGNKSANIVLIEGAPGTPAQRMRTQGFKSVVKRHKYWKIVYSQGIPAWTKEGSLAAMEAFLQTGKSVDLVTTHWHAAASAAAQALEEAKYNKKVFITSLEFSRELVPFIKQGKVDMTSSYSVEGVGFEVVEAASKLLKGEKIPVFIEADVTIVSKDNVDKVKPMF